MNTKKLLSIILSGCLLMISLAIPTFAVDEHVCIWGDYTYNNDADCKNDGTMTAHCTIDGCDKTNTILDTDHPRTGHKYVSSFIAPTCTQKGYKIYICAKCNDTYTDSYVEATGHHFGDWVSDDNASFFKNGTKTHTCIDCDETETVEDEGTAGINNIFGVITKVLLPIIRDLISNLFGNL